jgi:hypothetical protein
MKKYLHASFLSLLIGPMFGAMIAVCSANADTDELVSFWKHNPLRGDSSAADYSAELRQNGIVDVNSLSQFLGTEFQTQALFSMSLIAGRSKPLEYSALERVMTLTTNHSADFELQSEAVRFLAACFLQDSRVAAFFNDGLHSYCFNTYANIHGVDASRRAADVDAEILNFLGEYANTDKSRDAQSNLIQTVHAFLMPMFVSAVQPFAMAVPIENTNSFHIALSAMNWPLFEKRSIADSCVKICLGYLANTDKLPAHIQRSDFKPTIDFLLYKSKGDPDILTQKLSDLCNGDSRMASAVLWLLIQAKGNTLASSALERFSISHSRNKDILESIQKGIVTEREAFDKPLDEVYAQRN